MSTSVDASAEDGRSSARSSAGWWPGRPSGGPLGDAARRWAASPWWVRVLVVWGAARAVTWVVTERVARFQQANLWSGADPAYLDFVRIWDGDWYRRIADTGYPLPLPVDGTGQPFQSEWAFYPAYPVLVRGLEAVTGLEFRVVAPTLSLVLGAAAALVLHRLFARYAGEGTALAAVALLATFPTSPVLQYAYTESLALFALAASTYLLVSRRYLLALLPVVLLGLTRPVGVPFGLVVLAHLLHRWWVRRQDPLPLRQAGEIVLLGLVTAASSAAFPVYVGWATGRPDAYTAVQSAWHGGDLDVLTPWWDTSRWLLGDHVGPVALALLVVGYTLLLLGPGLRVLGLELTVWCGAYALYLLVVLQPYTSVFRYLLLLFPLALLAAHAVRTRAHLLTWLAAHVSLQVVWIAWLWRFTPPSDVPP
ncbi:hypothetical protein [Thalassiella azotivora]